MEIQAAYPEIQGMVQKMTKADQIRDFVGKNPECTVNAIVDAVGCRFQQPYSMAHKKQGISIVRRNNEKKCYYILDDDNKTDKVVKNTLCSKDAKKVNKTPKVKTSKHAIPSEIAHPFRLKIKSGGLTERKFEQTLRLVSAGLDTDVELREDREATFSVCQDMNEIVNTVKKLQEVISFEAVLEIPISK